MMTSSVYYLRPKAKAILAYLQGREGVWVRNMQLLDMFGASALRRCRELMEAGRLSGDQRPVELAGGRVERLYGPQMGRPEAVNTSFYRWTRIVKPMKLQQGMLF